MEKTRIRSLLRHARSELERDAFTLRLGIDGTRIHLLSNDSNILAFIASYFIGFADQDSPEQNLPTATIYICQDLQITSLLTASLKREPIPYESEPLVLCDRDEDPNQVFVLLGKVVAVLNIEPQKRQINRVLMFVKQGDVSHQFEAMRVFRYVCELLLMNRGMVPLHASALVGPGGALCIVGEKWAGKTTTLINGLLNGAGCFMANDKVLIFEKEGQFFAHGLPIAAGVRVSTLRLFDALAPLLTESTLYHPDNESLDNRELSNPRTRVYVTPHKLSATLGCGIVSRAPVVCLVFPKYNAGNGEISLARLPKEHALRALEEQCGEPLFVNEPHWKRWLYGQCNGGNANSVAARLVESVPIVQLCQNVSTNGAAARMLATLASGSYVHF